MLFTASIWALTTFQSCRTDMKSSLLNPIFVAKDALRFGVGEEVLILRPHLWSAHVGIVESEKDGVHRVKINTKPDGSICSPFHADIAGQCLEATL